MNKAKQSKRTKILICLGLAAITFAVYWPTLQNSFTSYDDGLYITGNPHVIQGLTQDSIIWAFTHPHVHMWHPLTTLSHMLDCRLFGLNASGHHLTSLLFHIASALLVFLILTTLTKTVWPGAFIAAVFALHPVQVESVAWAAERKTVLSGLFWLLTMAAYIRYARQPGFGRYLAVLLVSYNARLYLVHKTAGRRAIYNAVFDLCPLYYDQAGGCHASVCSAPA